MQIDTRFSGTPLKPYRTTVTWRAAMNYAAATGDDNPLYFDDEREGGIIAPPMYAVAATWPVLENLPDFIRAVDFPRQILLTQVHYTEHLQFHCPLRPGQELEINGEIAAVKPHRAGTQIVIRLNARDRSARAVFTEHVGALLRGVQCIGEGRGRENLPPTPATIQRQTAAWDCRLPIDSMLPYVYDGCTNIVFPIHTSKKFARRAGLPGIILQGTATLALAVRELIRRYSPGNPYNLKIISCRFTDMVAPGSEILLKAYGNDDTGGQMRIGFDMVNARGKKAVSDGYAEFVNG